MARKRSRRYQKAAAKVDRTKRYPVVEGMSLIKSLAGPKFDEAVDVAVRIGNDDVGGAGGFGGGDGRQRLARHEISKAPVLEPGGPELIAGDGAGHALHVDGDQDAKAALRLRAGRAQRRQQRDGSENGTDD